MTGDIEITRGSDNVSADLGFENPEVESLKAKLSREIRAALKARGLILYNENPPHSPASAISSRWIISARPGTPSTASISPDRRPTSRMASPAS